VSRRHLSWGDRGGCCQSPAELVQAFSSELAGCSQIPISRASSNDSVVASSRAGTPLERPCCAVSKTVRAVGGGSVTRSRSPSRAPPGGLLQVQDAGSSITAVGASSNRVLARPPSACFFQSAGMFGTTCELPTAPVSNRMSGSVWGLPTFPLRSRRYALDHRCYSEGTRRFLGAFWGFCHWR